MAFNEDKFINSISESLSTERIKQKKVFRKAIDYYNCKSEYHIDFLEPLFSDWENDKKSIIFTEIGATSSIVDEISLVYSQVPERSFTDKNGEPLEDDKLIKYIDSVYENISNDMYQSFEKNVNAQSTGTILYSFNSETKKIEGKLLTPDNYDIVANELNTSRADAIFYEVSTKDDLTNKQKIVTYFYIDKEVIKSVDVAIDKNRTEVSTITPKSININNPKISEKDENKYGVIPVVTVTTNFQSMNYFDDKNARLFVKGEELIITKDISSNEASFYQGFSQAVLYEGAQTASSGSVLDQFKMGAKSIVKLRNKRNNSESEKLEFLNPSTDITQLNDDTQKAFLNLASNFGLGETDGNAKANASGISLVVSDSKKNKLINANRPKYVTAEKKSFDIIRAINNYHYSFNKSIMKFIPDDINISVNFKEIETNLGTQDQIDWYQFFLDNDLKSDYRIVMEIDPDLTEEQAKELVTEAKEQNKTTEMLTDENNEESIDDEITID